MKSKKLETFLYSLGGVVAIFIVAIAVNVIVSAVRLRADLTQDKLHTLSDGTKAILRKLDTPVKVRLYVLTGESPDAVILKNHARRVEDMLAEFRAVAGDKLELEKLEPQPDSDAEDSARIDGVEGQTDPLGERIYLGVSVSCLDQKAALPFLTPSREKLLEYDLIRAITEVTRPAKPVVGVLSSLPVFGQPMNPMMMRMGQQGGAPWIFLSELRRDFTVRQVETTVEKIDDDIKVLVVIHPKNLGEGTLFALDQFVLRGGKLLAFLDPFSTVDSSGNPMMGGFGGSTSSSLGKLTEAWGISWDSTKVVADMNFVTRIRRGERAESAPAVLSLTADAVNADDPVTGQLDNLMLWFAGAFTGTPAEGLKQTVLLHTTPNSQLVDAMMAQMASEQTAKEFKASGKEYPLAIRLTGKFKTAFPKGKPGAETASDGDKEKEKDKNAKPDAKTGEALKESKEDGVVLLVGDTDLIYDRYCVDVQNFFGQTIVVPFNGNLTFFQGLVEQLSGDSNLIQVRSRASVSRPFTLVKQMQAQASARYQAEISALEKSLQETQRRLSELQQNKEKGQRFILSPEQKKEIENFRKQEAEANRKLRDVRKQLRQDVDSLQRRLKWLNILAMPLAVALSGVVLAVFKRKRTAAK
jgi:ABC-type uncharacterized transport system involved in gliding motility auxiliary subunit